MLFIFTKLKNEEEEEETKKKVVKAHFNSLIKIVQFYLIEEEKIKVLAYKYIGRKRKKVIE